MLTFNCGWNSDRLWNPFVCSTNRTLDNACAAVSVLVTLIIISCILRLKEKMKVLNKVHCKVFFAADFRFCDKEKTQILSPWSPMQHDLTQFILIVEGWPIYHAVKSQDDANRVTKRVTWPVYYYILRLGRAIETIGSAAQHHKFSYKSVVIRVRL